MQAELEFAELLITKYSHDIAGQIGAISNGVEFLQDDEFGMQEQALNMIAVASKELIARLNFYRYAYGVNRSDGEADIKQIAALATAFLEGGKITLKFDPTHIPSSPLSNRGAKLLLNTLQLVSVAMIHGGEISVTIASLAPNVLFSIKGAGRGLKLASEVKEILTKEGYHKPSAYNVQAWLVAKIADELSLSLKLDLEEDLIVCEVKI